jgi:hypothetical protein
MPSPAGVPPRSGRPYAASVSEVRTEVLALAGGAAGSRAAEEMQRSRMRKSKGYVEDDSQTARLQLYDSIN